MLGLVDFFPQCWGTTRLWTDPSCVFPRFPGCSHAQNFFGEAEVPFLMLGIRRQGMDMLQGNFDGVESRQRGTWDMEQNQAL